MSQYHGGDEIARKVEQNTAAFLLSKLYYNIAERTMQTSHIQADLTGELIIKTAEALSGDEHTDGDEASVGRELFSEDHENSYMKQWELLGFLPVHAAAGFQIPENLLCSKRTPLLHAYHRHFFASPAAGRKQTAAGAGLRAVRPGHLMFLRYVVVKHRDIWNRAFRRVESGIKLDGTLYYL